MKTALNHDIDLDRDTIPAAPSGRMELSDDLLSSATGGEGFWSGVWEAVKSVFGGGGGGTTNISVTVGDHNNVSQGNTNTPAPAKPKPAAPKKPAPAPAPCNCK